MTPMGVIVLKFFKSYPQGGRIT